MANVFLTTNSQSRRGALQWPCENVCLGGVMPIRRKAQDAGIFDPSELALLARIFERLKVESDSADRLEGLASRILANYMAGITDEEELLSLSRQPLGR
ncbi:hypothetical protein [Mesorhizobium sp. M4B.F.Ca.ET.089.01.1.1]|uniref:hypothetical protein n=1 Tax=unclassified Mesorhizobium TaxID=325217 RepID=UPI0032AF3EE7